MTVTGEGIEAREIHRTRQRVMLALAIGVTVPGVFLRLSDTSLPHPAEAAVFGAAIVGAAFLLSWAAEVAQIDISRGLAIAVLALIAVLPEYAVDLVFAWKGGNSFERFGPSCPPVDGGTESPCSLALANMTGANRLLIGIGWALVVFIAWYQWRRRGERRREVKLSRPHSVELSYLTVACAYSLTLPIKQSVMLWDALVLVGIFTAYTIRISRAPAEEPELVGPAAYLGTFGTRNRRLAVVALFVFSAVVIVLTAESFADALVETGSQLGISEFLLVQWLAPLASESPELLVAALYAWRLNTNAGLGTLVSSKVNQWTLLVGTLPIVFAVASGGFNGLPIEARQREEILLTAAQSVFAVAVLANLSISTREAMAIFLLFWAQFIIGAVVPGSLKGVELVTVSVIYLVLGAALLVRKGARMWHLLRDGFLVPHEALQDEERPSA